MSEREAEMQTEQELIAGFLRWAQKNSISVAHHSYDELYDYIYRYLKAAG